MLVFLEETQRGGLHQDHQPLSVNKQHFSSVKSQAPHFHSRSTHTGNYTIETAEHERKSAKKIQHFLLLTFLVLTRVVHHQHFILF